MKIQQNLRILNLYMKNVYYVKKKVIIKYIKIIKKKKIYLCEKCYKKGIKKLK